jgi:hypothetical protein
MLTARRGRACHFRNVYMFCMNDEVLYIGYHKVANYIPALCCNKNSRSITADITMFPNPTFGFTLTRHGQSGRC